MYDVVALGELVVDFIQNGSSAVGNPVFEANLGGAPCNVLAMLSRLGYQTAFISKVGDDYFGRILGETVKEVGISDEGVIYAQNINTTLDLVLTKADGDRDFSLYRKPGADIMLTENEINKKLIEECRIFHFDSLSLTNESATKAAVAHAKSMGKLISFDPDLRESLWESNEQAREAIWYGIGECNILKIADNEIKWLTGLEDYDEGVRVIRKKSDIKLINVTLGKDGSLAYYADRKIYGKPFLNNNTVDTTGAKDAFCACVIGFVLEHGLNNLSEADLERMLSFANAAASIVTTRKGAIRCMPDKEEINALIITGKREEPQITKSCYVLLSAVDMVKEFVDDMSKIEGDTILHAGRYVVDAKSIMGIFSLDLSKPLKLEIESWKEEYLAILEKYMNK